MDTPGLPTPEELHTALAALCVAAGISHHQLTSVQREENEYSRSYASEIVVCRFSDGSKRRVFLKYMTKLDEGHRDHGMRGGLAYEAFIYARLLRDLIRPEFFGLHTAHDGSFWLVLECPDNTVPLDIAEDDTAIFKSAAWLGKFHAAQERRVAVELPTEVRAYDGEFFRGWAQRTNEYAGQWHRREPWLSGLCANFDDVIEVLLAAPTTLVHGEYYPHNILFRDGEIFTVDWESAALGAGEIDLVALTEGWPEDMETECWRIYRDARWPAGAPELFERRIVAARVYMHLRWMGEHPGWTELEDGAQWQLAELKRWAVRFRIAM